MGMDVKWSPSRIDTANYCSMRYWLKYVEKWGSARLSVFPKGIVLHKGLENFWKRLGTYDEVYTAGGNFRPGSDAKRYYDADSFAKHLQGKWMQTVMNDKRLRKRIETESLSKKEREKLDKRLIVWSHGSQPYETKAQIGSIAKSIFDQLVDEGPPLYSELKFDFIMQDLYFDDKPRDKFNLHFTGFIDEVRMRDNVLIRDFKSGKPWIDGMKLRHDPQLTVYNTALCASVKNDDVMAERLGLTERRKDYFKDGFLVDPDFTQEFFMVEAAPIAERMLEKNSNVDPNRLPKSLHPVKRENAHFYEVMKMIKSTEEKITSGRVLPERGRKCDFCDMKVACENKLHEVGPVDKHGQNLFEFTVADYERRIVADEGTRIVTSKQSPGVETSVDPKKAQKVMNFKNKRGW